jgi:hypothetical protein
MKKGYAHGLIVTVTLSRFGLTGKHWYLPLPPTLPYGPMCTPLDVAVKKREHSSACPIVVMSQEEYHVMPTVKCN